MLLHAKLSYLLLLCITLALCIAFTLSASIENNKKTDASEKLGSSSEWIQFFSDLFTKLTNFFRKNGKSVENQSPPVQFGETQYDGLGSDETDTYLLREKRGIDLNELPMGMVWTETSIMEEEAVTFFEEEFYTELPVLTATMASSEEDSIQEDSDWKEIVHKLIQKEYEIYTLSDAPSIEIRPLNEAEVDNEYTEGMKSIILESRSETFKLMRNMIRKRWRVRDELNFSFQFFIDHLAKDSHVQKSLNSWSEEDLEMLWVWTFQTSIYNFIKFERFYKSVVKRTRRGWERTVYSIITTRYPEKHTHNVTVAYFNFINMNEQVSLNERKTQERLEQEKKRARKFTLLRSLLQIRWRLSEQSDFESKYFWKKLSKDNYVIDLLQGWDPNELELLWIWTHQTVIDDFVKFESFYRKAVWITKDDWRRHTYDLIKSRYGGGNVKISQGVLTVIDVQASLFDERSEKLLKVVQESDMKRAYKFILIRKILRLNWESKEGSSQKSITPEFIDNSITEEINGVLKEWSEKDLEMLKIWTQQNDTEDFLMFEMFFWKVLRIAKPGWQSDLILLIKTWFMDQSQSPFQIEIGELNYNEEDVDEQIATDRIELFSKVKTELKKLWSLDDNIDIKQLSSNYFRKKLGEDAKAQELVNGWSDEDLEMLWVWLIQNSTDDFQKFENLYRRLIKITVAGWEKVVYKLLVSRLKGKELINASVLDIDPSTFKNSNFDVQQTETIRQEKILQFMFLRQIFKLKWKMGENYLNREFFIEKINTLDKTIQNDVYGLAPKEFEILMVWLYQNVTDNYLKFYSFANSVAITEKQGWRRVLFKTFKERYKNETNRIQAVEPVSFSNQEENDPEHDQITSEERRQTFIRLRRNLRYIWKAKDLPIKLTLPEFSAKLKEVSSVYSIVKNWSDDEIELLWIFTVQTQQEDFRKFEMYLWTTTRVTKEGWKQNVADMLKSMYRDDETSSHTQVQDNNLEVIENDFNQGNYSKKERQIGDRMRILRMLVRRRWNMTENAKYSFHDLQEMLNNDPYVQTYLENVFEDDLDLFYSWIAQTKITDFHRFRILFKKTVNKYNAKWRENTYQLLRKIFNIESQTAPSDEQEGKSTTTKSDPNDPLQMIRYIARIRWKIASMQEYDKKYLQRKFKNDEQIRNKLEEFKEVERDVFLPWVFQNDEVSYSDFNDYHKLVKRNAPQQETTATDDTEEVTETSTHKIEDSTRAIEAQVIEAGTATKVSEPEETTQVIETETVTQRSEPKGESPAPIPDEETKMITTTLQSEVESSTQSSDGRDAVKDTTGVNEGRAVEVEDVTISLESKTENPTKAAVTETEVTETSEPKSKDSTKSAEFETETPTKATATEIVVTEASEPKPEDSTKITDFEKVKESLVKEIEGSTKNMEGQEVEGETATKSPELEPEHSTKITEAKTVTERESQDMDTVTEISVIEVEGSTKIIVEEVVEFEIVTQSSNADENESAQTTEKLGNGQSEMQGGSKSENITMILYKEKLYIPSKYELLLNAVLKKIHGMIGGFKVVVSLSSAEFQKMLSLTSSNSGTYGRSVSDDYQIIVLKFVRSKHGHIGHIESIEKVSQGTMSYTKSSEKSVTIESGQDETATQAPISEATEKGNENISQRTASSVTGTTEDITESTTRSYFETGTEKSDEEETVDSSWTESTSQKPDDNNGNKVIKIIEIVETNSTSIKDDSRLPMIFNESRYENVTVLFSNDTIYIPANSSLIDESVSDKLKNMTGVENIEIVSSEDDFKDKLSHSHCACDPASKAPPKADNNPTEDFEAVELTFIKMDKENRPTKSQNTYKGWIVGDGQINNCKNKNGAKRKIYFIENEGKGKPSNYESNTKYEVVELGSAPEWGNKHHDYMRGDTDRSPGRGDDTIKDSYLISKSQSDSNKGSEKYNRKSSHHHQSQSQAMQTGNNMYKDQSVPSINSNPQLNSGTLQQGHGREQNYWHNGGNGNQHNDFFSKHLQMFQNMQNTQQQGSGGIPNWHQPPMNHHSNHMQMQNPWANFYGHQNDAYQQNSQFQQQHSESMQHADAWKANEFNQNQMNGNGFDNNQGSSFSGSSSSSSSYYSSSSHSSSSSSTSNSQIGNMSKKIKK